MIGGGEQICCSGSAAKGCQQDLEHSMVGLAGQTMSLAMSSSGDTSAVSGQVAVESASAASAAAAAAAAEVVAVCPCLYDTSPCLHFSLIPFLHSRSMIFPLFEKDKKEDRKGQRGDKKK